MSSIDRCGHARVKIAPITQKPAVGNAQSAGNAGLFGSDDSGEVQNIGNIVFAISFGNVVPDRLSHYFRFETSEQRRFFHLPPSHRITHIIVEFGTPTVGNVGRNSRHEPIGQRQQQRTLQRVFQTTAVEHIINKQLRNLPNELFAKTHLVARERNFEARFGQVQFVFA